jgi:microcin C transport system substrate-binding protein
MPSTIQFFAKATACALLMILNGCSGSKKTDAASAANAAPDASTAPLTNAENAVIDAYYKSKPTFFIFATPADLPKDLAWENGSDEKPFGDPRALRGGTVNGFMLAWPPTLRFVGPDANHSMRDVFLDDNVISLCQRHPVTRRWYPGLATAWAVSKDKRTVYFRIDPDARFSDGVAITADDFFYLFYFMQSPCINDPWYNNWYGQHYTSITNYDDHTIAITLPEAKPDPVEFASVNPLPAHFYRVLDDKYIEKFQWKFEPTTGPWEVLPENITQGTSITLTHVKNWWAENKPFFAHRYNPEKRRFILIRDMNIAYESFKKGDLDMFGLTLPEYWYDRSQNIEQVKKGWIEREVFYNDYPRPTIGLYLNRANPILADKRVRQGIQHACNWQRVIDFYFRGDYQRLKGEVDGFGAFDSPTIEPRPFDVDKARALFAEAGFTKAGTDGVLIDDKGRRLSFAVTMPQTTPYPEQGAILKEEALKAGLELNLDVQDPTTEYKKTMNKQHDIVLSGWSVRLPYPRFWENYHSVNAYGKDGKPLANTNNITCTADPELDRMIEKYESSSDMQEMIDLAHKMEAYLYDEASFVPGFKVPFYRLGHWAWIKFPENFDVPLSQGPQQYGLYWVDPDAKARTLEARKNGTDLGEKTGVHGLIPPAGNH